MNIAERFRVWKIRKALEYLRSQGEKIKIHGHGDFVLTRADGSVEKWESDNLITDDGFDFICEDISKPYFEQECAIIEANSCPSIDMHHYPVSGKVRNVAGRLLDYCSIS